MSTEFQDFRVMNGSQRLKLKSLKRRFLQALMVWVFCIIFHCSKKIKCFKPKYCLYSCLFYKSPFICTQCTFNSFWKIEINNLLYFVHKLYSMLSFCVCALQRCKELPGSFVTELANIWRTILHVFHQQLDHSQTFQCLPYLKLPKVSV